MLAAFWTRPAVDCWEHRHMLCSQVTASSPFRYLLPLHRVLLDRHPHTSRYSQARTRSGAQLEPTELASLGVACMVAAEKAELGAILC